MRTLASSIAVVLGLTLLAAPGLARQESSWSFTDVERIEFDGLSGDIVLEPAAGEQVTLLLRYDVRPAGAFRPEVEQTGSGLYIGESWSGRNTSGEVEWILGLPANAPAMSIASVSGDLGVSGIDARVEFRSASGHITLDGVTLRPDSAFKTASGDYRLRDVIVADGVKMTTASGEIDLHGVHAQGEFGFGTASGDVTIDNSRGILAASSASGDVTLEGSPPEGPARFSSASGNVFVRLQAPPVHDLKASSASGNVVWAAPLPAAYTLVLTAREDYGEIRSPLEPTSERTFDRHDQPYREQTVVRGSGGPRIELMTASGLVEVRERR